jgi:hypothetical protein
MTTAALAETADRDARAFVALKELPSVDQKKAIQEIFTRLAGQDYTDYNPAQQAWWEVKNEKFAVKDFPGNQ